MQQEVTYIHINISPPSAQVKSPQHFIFLYFKLSVYVLWAFNLVSVSPSSFVSWHLLFTFNFHFHFYLSLIIVYCPINEKCCNKKNNDRKNDTKAFEEKVKTTSVSDCVVIRFWHFVLMWPLFVKHKGGRGLNY